MSIPNEQYSFFDKEKYITTQTVTNGTQTVPFNVTGSLSTTSVSNQTSKTPQSRTLHVAITNYNSSFSYTYSTDGRIWKNLSVANGGTASVSVSFSQMSFSGNSNKAYGSKKVYFKCQNGTAAAITVNVEGTKNSSWGGSKYSYNYSIGTTTAGSFETVRETTSEIVSYSANKRIDARDAMPLVASGVTVTQDMVYGNTSVTSAMSFKMLGSAIEFKFYSMNNAIGVGETIQNVNFSTTSASICGRFGYNLVNNLLSIVGLEGKSITAHLEDCAYTIPNSKDNYLPVYMVVAPGTYSAQLEVTTDEYIYSVPFSSKTYSRASKKGILIDLSAANVTRTKIPSPDDPDEPEVPEDPIVPQTPEWETAYAVFASDRHANTSAIGSACRNMPATNPYVCLIGDMVGAATKTDAPRYNSSTVKAEVDAVFTNATTQIVWGLHDAGVNDDAGIVKCASSNSSSLIYTGKDSKDNTQYYVYAIAYNDIADTTTTASAAASTFKNWVSTITDTTIPVIVVSHVPLHYRRNDNFGAVYWNKAITYAATGSENGGVNSIIRNVIFVHGHNHTSDTTEFYYTPGTNLQIAKGRYIYDTCTIPYTYITGGYLKDNPRATLVQINEDNIVFTKYYNGNSTQLGTLQRIGSQN